MPAIEKKEGRLSGKIVPVLIFCNSTCTIDVDRAEASQILYWELMTSDDEILSEISCVSTTRVVHTTKYLYQSTYSVTRLCIPKTCFIGKTALLQEWYYIIISREISRINVESNANVSKTSSVSIFRVSQRNDRPRKFYNMKVLKKSYVRKTWVSMRLQIC
jgi:hypothetical protein